MSPIGITYKAREVEETLDIYFYRPLGYWVAKGAFRIGLTPNFISIASIFLGVIAGHFFYYPTLASNAWGILLLVISETFDSADGQLARLSQIHSKFGRILDGLASNIIYVSVYIHLVLRIASGWQLAYIFPLALLAGFSHSCQGALADYYRQAYIYFVYGKRKSELDESIEIAEKYRQLSWKKDLGRKLFMRIYLNYTRQQEVLTRRFLELFHLTKQRFADQLPEAIGKEYRQLNYPMIKYYNILTSNTRMMVLFASLILGRPLLFFLFEFLVLNTLLGWVWWRQNIICSRLIEVVKKSS